MRTIERTSAFKKDYKRTKATPRHKNIETLLEEIVGLLVRIELYPKSIPTMVWRVSGTIIGNAT